MARRPGGLVEVHKAAGQSHLGAGLEDAISPAGTGREGRPRIV